MLLKGKVVLVTGGAKRVGRAVTLSLAQRGARVAIHYNQSKREAQSKPQVLPQIAAQNFRLGCQETQNLARQDLDI